MNRETPVDLWDQLEQTLAVQGQYLRKGRWEDLESSLARSRSLVQQITASGTAVRPVSAEQRQRLLRAYERLMLTAEAQKQTVSQQLRRLRTSERTLDAYRAQAGVG
jgi:hypothetical protein